nr:hypothetical protein [Planctomycetota bacterium]
NQAGVAIAFFNLQLWMGQAPFLSDCVVVYTGDEPGDVNDYIATFMEIASGYLFDIQLMPIFNGFNSWKECLHIDNDNYPHDLFSDSGFKEEYRQEFDFEREPNERRAGADQFTHFLGFMGAGFYASFEWVAELFCKSWESGNTDCADYRLGLAAIEVGRSLNAYYTFSGWNPMGINIGFTPSSGMKPSEVGDWIRNNLAE